MPDPIKQARDRFALAKEAWADVRREAEIDRKMVSGDQWDPAIVAARGARPCITDNRLAAPVRTITNRARQDRPQPKVNPADADANSETATVLEEHMRHIWYASQGDVAADNAVECTASGGFGFYRIDCVYVDDDSFDQEPRLRRILDPMTALYCDPNVQEPDFSDAKWWFIRKRILREEFESDYGFAPSSIDEDFEHKEDWGDKEYCFVAEYWRVETTKQKLLALADGQVGIEKKIDLSTGAKIVQQRERESRKVIFSLFDGQKTWAETSWIGNWIPIIGVIGGEMVVEGKRKFSSAVRDGIGKQKVLNSAESAIAEAVGKATKSQFMGFTGQFKSKTWSDPNSLFLEAEYDLAGGSVAQLPTVISHEPPIQALTQLVMMQIDSIKASFGYLDSVAKPSQADLSGVAVQRRTAQADLVNFHFEDNLIRSQWHAARVLLDLIQKLYDVPREIRTMKEDGTVGLIPIARKLDDGSIGYVDGKHPDEHHRLDFGRYDVVVTSAPSYASRIEEEIQLIQVMLQSDPEGWRLYADLLFKLRNYGDLEKRAKLALPPAIQQAIQSENAGIPPQVQAQMAALNQQLQMAHAQLREMLFEKKAKIIESKAKIEVALIGVQGDVTVQGMKTDHEKALAFFDADMARIDKQLSMLHESEMQPQPTPQGGTVQ